MGMLGDWLSEARVGLTGRPTRAQLYDFQFMSTMPIWSLLAKHAQATDLDITVTMVNRLCHLIHRMERHPYDFRCRAARWFHDNLPLVPVPAEHRKLVDDLDDRLMRAVHEYEQHFGYQDPYLFDLLVGRTPEDKCWVLFGPPTADQNGRIPMTSTPAGSLAFAIQELWQCSIRG